MNPGSVGTNVLIVLKITINENDISPINPIVTAVSETLRFKAQASSANGIKANQPPSMPSVRLGNARAKL